MVAPKDRSRSKRRIHKRVPGGTTKKRFVSTAKRSASCSTCGRKLPGTKGANEPRSLATKSARKPSRPFGGALCSTCTRDRFKKQARA